MAQEFEIFSESIRDKLNSLLPAQNINSIGVELTGSTQIIPIVDLTEVAEGSNLRQDLQTSLSHGSCTAFSVNNTTTTVINTTGYFRIFGQISLAGAATESKVSFILNDGATDKVIYTITANNVTAGQFVGQKFDFNVFMSAGDSFKILAANTTSNCIGNTRQIADLSGNLVNPT